MPNSPPADIKADAHKLIDTLPDAATWDDVMHRIYVRQCIDAGIADANNGRVLDVAQVRAQFGLQP